LKKILTLAIISLLLISTFSILASQVKAEIPGSSEKGILKLQWSYGLAPRYWWGYFGSSPAIADLGPDVNQKGTEPDSDLEIVTGCDGYWFYSPELGYSVPGLWRAFDSQGNVEWVKSTESDEARSSPVIIDLDGDGKLEIAAGTTSGWHFQVMNRKGEFIWMFPKFSGYVGGPFVWPSSPAATDINPNVKGIELVIGNRYHGSIWAFKGIPDGKNDGITISAADFPGFPYPLGTEGVDWDVLWIVKTDGEVWATPAIADVDNDGTLEVVIGSTDGKLYIVNGINGGVETSISIGSAIYASAALANLDGDAYLEIVVGATDGKIYCFQWDGKNIKTEWTYSTGGAIYSSASVGDVDGDGSFEIILGSTDGKIYCLSSSGGFEWSYTTGGAIYSSPALANRETKGLGIYIGSTDAYLYLISGSGSLVDRFLTYGQIRTSPAVADIDGDGKLEIVFYDWSSYDTLWCLEDTESNVGKYAIEWQMFRHDASRTGAYKILRTPKQRLLDALFSLEKSLNELMFTVARARSEAYAKSLKITKDYYDDLMSILLYIMTYGLDKYNLWPNWHVSSHFKGIMDAVRESPLLQALYHEHWVWQHGKQSEFIRDVLLDFGMKAYSELNFESKTESQIAMEHYNWMLYNFYDYGGLTGISQQMNNQYISLWYSVPDDLPDKPFINVVISSLEQTTQGINCILQTSKPNTVFWISDKYCTWATLGDTLAYRDSTATATLEALHNAFKTVNTVATYTVAGATAGYILIKVASALTTLGTGALAVEGILALAAGKAALANLISTTADLAVTYLVGRLYAETLASSISDIGLIKMIWDDSIKACQAAVQEGLKDPKGQIIEVNIPDVISTEEIVNVYGNATLINLDTQPANVSMFVNVYDLNGSLLTFSTVPIDGPEVVGPEEIKTFSFNFTIYRSLASLKYIAVVYAAIGFSIIGPSTTSFTICSPEEHASVVSKLELTTVQTGTIKQGDVILVSFKSPDDTSKLQFVLFYPWGRLDLHVYDEYGNHVGINYETGTIEDQIAGSFYSGMNTLPQLIKIAGDLSGKEFTIKIVGFQIIGEESFALMVMRVPSLPATLDAFPKKLYFSNKINPTARFVTTGFNVFELGSQQSLQAVKVEITDLTSKSGYVIRVNNISIEPNIFNVPAGGFVTVTINVTLDSFEIGNYTGTIYVTAQDQIIQIFVQFEYVTLQYLISSSLRGLKNYIVALPSDAFDKKQPITIPNMKKALSNKIDAVIAMINEGSYVEAIDKLRYDIIAKMDGDSTAVDWIVDPRVQMDLQNWIGWIIMDIQQLI